MLLDPSSAHTGGVGRRYGCFWAVLTLFLGGSGRAPVQAHLIKFCPIDAICGRKTVLRAPKGPLRWLVGFLGPIRGLRNPDREVWLGSKLEASGLLLGPVC